MRPDAHRAEYESRMHRVTEYIDRHLDERLDLETLAGVAHFSPFHFHRLFAAWMGETLGDYLRRRRVELAAIRLIAQPRMPVLQIALAVGFGSAEAFARAFRGRFECSPSAWRANSNPDQANRKTDQAGAGAAMKHGASPKEVSMNVKVIDRKPVTVAYLRYFGPYGDPVSRFWQETAYPWMVTHDLLGKPRYGISHDDPSITTEKKCRYDACVEIAPDSAPPGKALNTVIPGGKYASLYFKGTIPEIGAAWSAILRDWLPSSGLQLDTRPCFEYYPTGSSFDPKTGVFDCQICIPVVPL